MMTRSQIYRLSGLGLMIGAVAFVVHIVLRSLLTAGVDPSTFAKQGPWVPINALGFLGAMLVLMGLPAIYARLAEPTGLLGLVGLVLISVAWTFFGVFLSLYATLLLPWLADKAPALIAPAAPLPGVHLRFHRRIAGMARRDGIVGDPVHSRTLAATMGWLRSARLCRLGGGWKPRHRPWRSRNQPRHQSAFEPWPGAAACCGWLPRLAAVDGAHSRTRPSRAFLLGFLSCGCLDVMRVECSRQPQTAEFGRGEAHIELLLDCWIVKHDPPPRRSRSGVHVMTVRPTVRGATAARSDRLSRKAEESTHCPRRFPARRAVTYCSHAVARASARSSALALRGLLVVVQRCAVAR